MIDVRGREAQVGDAVVIAERRGNIAGLRFGKIHELDQAGKRFKIENEDGSISSWMQWYYHNIARPEYCKVLNLD